MIRVLRRHPNREVGLSRPSPACETLLRLRHRPSCHAQDRKDCREMSNSAPGLCGTNRYIAKRSCDSYLSTTVIALAPLAWTSCTSAAASDEQDRRVLLRSHLSLEALLKLVSAPHLHRSC
ncbi:hypothetical protein GQ53DRAFT_151509 [Thozetella sp. PMI_491]|nr:hypothetical protein GQ53DRAFT_151509 [Thozetella sp. PMI_491]